MVITPKPLTNQQEHPSSDQGNLNSALDQATLAKPTLGHLGYHAQSCQPVNDP